MKHEFLPNIPLYVQLIDELKRAMVSGQLRPGEKVSSVRDLALTYGVTPNTIQRSLQVLEQEGYIRTERTTGKFVTDDTTRIHELRNKQLEHYIQDAVGRLYEYGYSPEEIILCMKKELNRTDG